MDLLRDRTLVEQFQAGDAAAFDDLYRRYFARLYRFCLRRVGDSHEAEEIAQEAFTRAYRHMPTFAGDKRFYPWVTVIAARLCVDTHRRRARTEPSDTIDLGVVDGGEDAVFAEVDRALLTEAIERLAPRHRDVLELRERQGWSYTRIAEHYGVTLGAVEALLWRARRALRREFLAIAGPDGGRLATLPLFGLLGRRLGNLRDRLTAYGIDGNHLSPIAAQVAAVVVVVGTAVGGVVHSDNGRSADMRNVAVGDIGAVEAPLPVAAGDVPAPLATAKTPAEAMPADEPAAAVEVLGTRVTREDPDRARSMPHNVEIFGFGVGADPEADTLDDDVAEAVDAWSQYAVGALNE